MKIVLTQSEGRLEALAEALAARGHEVVSLPLVRTETLRGPEAQAAAQAVAGADWLLFTSRAGVRAWHDLGFGLRGGPPLGAVGEATAAALRGLGGEVALVGEPQSAEGLAARFLARVGQGAFVGLPQGDRALPTLRERLEAGGMRTRTAVLYTTRRLPWQAGVSSARGDALGLETVDAVLVASPSAAYALPAAVGRRARLFSLGPSTSRAIRARGWSCAEAARPDAAAVLEALAAAAPEKPAGKLGGKLGEKPENSENEVAS